jgi:hypothetical protein
MERFFVNDANGIILRKYQQGRELKQLVVNGQVITAYGKGVDPNKPNNDKGQPNYVDQGEFGATFEAINNRNATGASRYTVREGDTLRMLAQGLWGDASQWYRIADANGLSSLGPDAELSVGMQISLPNNIGGLHNTSATYKPYEPGSVIGDTTPSLPAPPAKEACGGWGKVIMTIIAVVVAVVITYFTWNPEAGITAGNIIVGIGAAVAGSVVSQVVGLATGIIDEFDWKAVAIAAVSGAIGGGLGWTAPANSSWGTIAAYAAANAAVSNAVTQGVLVAVGLQEKFDWNGVAAAAIGGAAGSAAGSALSGTNLGNSLGKVGTAVVTGAASRVASSYAAARFSNDKISGKQLWMSAVEGGATSGINAYAGQLTNERDARARQARGEAPVTSNSIPRSTGFNWGNLGLLWDAGKSYFQQPSYGHWPDQTDAESVRLARSGDADQQGRANAPLSAAQQRAMQWGYGPLNAQAAAAVSGPRYASASGVQPEDPNGDYMAGGSTPTGLDNRSALNAANQAAEPGRYTSRRGVSYTVQAGDTYSGLSGNDLTKVGLWSTVNGKDLQKGQTIWLDEVDQFGGDAQAAFKKIGGNLYARDNARLAEAARQKFLFSDGRDTKDIRLSPEYQASMTRQLGQSYKPYAQTVRTSENINAAASPAVEMREQAVYTAMGDYAGTEMVPVDNRSVMSYRQQMSNVWHGLTDAPIGTVQQIVQNPRESLSYAWQGVVGEVKGVINGGPVMAVEAVKGWAYIGAAARDGYYSLTGAPPQNYLSRAIEAGSAYSGQILKYEGTSEQIGGFAGEIISPVAYGAVVREAAATYGAVRSAGAASEGLAVAQAERAALTAAPRLGSASVEARMGVAREGYAETGWSSARIESHMRGIDFTQDVTMTTLQPAQRLVQWQVPGNPVGNYFAPVGTTASELGISPVGRAASYFEAIQPQTALRSTAREIVDTWTTPGVAYRAQGGGTQYFVGDTAGFRVVVGGGAPAPFSRLSPGGGLQAHENAGGHLINKHVGKTEIDLQNRLAAEPHISGSSSFYNRTAAEDAVSQALDANTTKVADWLSGTAPRLRIDHTLADPVGISVARGATGAVDASSARVILLREPTMPTGYKILTGFPTLP